MVDAAQFVRRHELAQLHVDGVIVQKVTDHEDQPARLGHGDRRERGNGFGGGARLELPAPGACRHEHAGRVQDSRKTQ